MGNLKIFGCSHGKVFTLTSFFDIFERAEALDSSLSQALGRLKRFALSVNIEIIIGAIFYVLCRVSELSTIHPGLLAFSVCPQVARNVSKGFGSIFDILPTNRKSFAKRHCTTFRDMEKLIDQMLYMT